MSFRQGSWDRVSYRPGALASFLGELAIKLGEFPRFFHLAITGIPYTSCYAQHFTWVLRTDPRPPYSKGKCFTGHCSGTSEKHFFSQKTPVNLQSRIHRFPKPSSPSVQWGFIYCFRSSQTNLMFLAYVGTSLATMVLSLFTSRVWFEDPLPPCLMSASVMSLTMLCCLHRLLYF